MSYDLGSYGTHMKLLLLPHFLTLVVVDFLLSSIDDTRLEIRANGNYKIIIIGWYNIILKTEDKLRRK